MSLFFSDESFKSLCPRDLSSFFGTLSLASRFLKKLSFKSSLGLLFSLFLVFLDSFPKYFPNRDPNLELFLFLSSLSVSLGTSDCSLSKSDVKRVLSVVL